MPSAYRDFLRTQKPRQELYSTAASTQESSSSLETTIQLTSGNGATGAGMSDMVSAQGPKHTTPTTASGTTPAAVSSAAYETSRIFEMVELIMLQDLPIKTIVRARQVNYFFRDVVDRSKSLRRAICLERRAMYLEPEPDQVYGTVLNRRGTPLDIVKLHPAIKNSSGMYGNTIERNESKFTRGFSKQARKLLNGHFDRCGNFRGWDKCNSNKMWRSMYFSQPPCREFTVHTWHLSGENSEITTQGSTLGALHDALTAEIVKYGGQQCFSVQLHGVAVETSTWVRELRKKEAEIARLTEADKEAQEEANKKAQEEANKKAQEDQSGFDLEAWVAGLHLA